MTTIAITLESVCSGGNHIDVGVTVGGGAKRILHMEHSQMVGDYDENEALIAVKVLLNLAARGSDLQAALVEGIEVTV